MVTSESDRIKKILTNCRIYTLRCGAPEINLALIPSGNNGWEKCFILLQIDGHTHILGVEPLAFQGERAPIRKLYLSLRSLNEMKELNGTIEFIPITNCQSIHMFNNCDEFINKIESCIGIENNNK